MASPCLTDRTWPILMYVAPKRSKFLTASLASCTCSCSRRPLSTAVARRVSQGIVIPAKVVHLEASSPHLQGRASYTGRPTANADNTSYGQRRYQVSPVAPELRNLSLVVHQRQAFLVHLQQVGAVLPSKLDVTLLDTQEVQNWKSSPHLDRSPHHQ